MGGVSDKEIISSLLKQEDDIVHISDAVQNDGEYSEPYPTGFFEFDDAMLGGVRAGDLVIGTGLSGHGKTTLFQNITINLSKNAFPSMWFSYEVIIENLYGKFKEMGMSPEELLIYTPRRATTGNLDWVRKKIREGVEKFNTKFVFIDHIDFLTPTKSYSSDQRRIILRDICQELKGIALEFNITIFLIAHVKKVQGREVEMQDIAESSGIYQLADYVMSVTRITNKKKIKIGVGSDEKEIDTEVMTNTSIAKILKNRLTGLQPFFTYKLEHNLIRSDNLVKPFELEK